MFIHKVLEKLLINAKAANAGKIVADLSHADAFDFGTVDLGQLDTNAEGSAVLSNDENEFFRLGLVPLPASICWYEFDLLLEKAEKRRLKKNGILVSGDSKKWRVFHFMLSHEGEIRPDETGSIIFHETQKFAPFSVEEGLPPAPTNDEAGMKRAQVLAFISRYLTLMLNSRTTEIEVVPAPEKLNRKREKRGKPAIPAYRLVRIVPERYKRGAENEAKRTHASPRLHWRRSHLRRYESGKMVVIPRCLVGKAELGSVSHEYQVTKRSTNVV